MRKTIIAIATAMAIPAMLLGSPAIASSVVPDETCGDLVGAGWNRMPDIAEYVKDQRGADKLGYGSECHIGGLVFSQCWLEPKLSVKQAIDLLLSKARAGKRLPDIPACGA